MVPLDTNAFVTAWLPLRSLHPADAALSFASGSHRDFALPYWQADAGMLNLVRARSHPDRIPITSRSHPDHSPITS